MRNYKNNLRLLSLLLFIVVMWLHLNQFTNDPSSSSSSTTAAAASTSFKVSSLKALKIRPTPPPLISPPLAQAVTTPAITHQSLPPSPPPPPLPPPPLPPPPLPPPPLKSIQKTSNLHYFSIFQKLCQWKFTSIIESGNHRCCPFSMAQRANLVYTMAPFVALKPAAPIKINIPPLSVKETLNCKTNRWGGINTFHNGMRRKSIPLVIDMFIVASEMDLMESRIYELLESTDYIIVGISPHNHRGDPQPNWYQHAKDEHKRFTKEMLKKIISINVGECDEHLEAKKKLKHGFKKNHGSVFEHQLTQRDCLWKHGIAELKKKLLLKDNEKNQKNQKITSNYQLPDDTIFIFTDVDELPDRHLIHHIKHCKLKSNALPAHLKMRINGHNFRMKCSDGRNKFTGASEIAEWRTIKQDGGAIYRFRSPPNVRKKRKNAIFDAGVHLTWYGSMAFVDYKGFTHAEGGYFGPMWGKNIQNDNAGSYCDINGGDYSH
jgi:hypothetical protein